MTKTASGYHAKFDDAFVDEWKHVEERWRAKQSRRWEEENAARSREAMESGDAAKAEAIAGEKQPETSLDRNGLVGLALSGGGIRSASFCMGVVQKLHRAGVIDRLHYMSTVSGGGYTGSSMSWFLSWRPESGSRFGTQAGTFPFTGGAPAGVRHGAGARSARTEPPLDGRAVLDYIRQRASYLNPGAGFTIVSAVAIVLRSLLTSVFGFILLLSLVSLAVLHLDLFRHTLEEAGMVLPGPLGPLRHLDIFAAAGLGLLGLLGIIVVGYSLATAVPFAERFAYGGRRFYQTFAGKLLAVALALFALSLLHFLMDLIAGEEASIHLTSLGSVSTVAGAAGGLLTHAMRDAKPGPLNLIVRTLIPPVALLLLVAGLATLGHLLAHAVQDLPAEWEIGFVLFTFAYCVFTNINLTGLHRFYRDRLMESFMPDPKCIEQDGQAARTKADGKALADICGVEDDGPYHLINTNVVLLGANKARLRSRQGDSFVLSRVFCGSEATGFIHTDK